MSLSFTDDQIKTITQSMLDAPAAIANAQASQVAALDNKAKILAKDQSNEVFTLNWINIINQYHAERKYLNGVLNTDYNPANIQPAGQLLDPNIHFPSSPIWIKFQPKQDPSNTGLPTSVWANTETEAITRATTNITLLKTGFTDGAGNTTTTGPFASGIVPVTSAAGFSVGNRVVFISGSNFLYGTISLIAGLNVTVTLVSANAGFGGILTGATMKNFHPGWTLGQRESGTGASAGDSAFMAGVKTSIDTAITDWEARLNAEKTALNANDATGAEASQITAAKGVVDGHIAVIDTWQSFPSIGVGTSRFGTNLPPLEANLAARPGQYASRIAEISAALGTLTQAPDGTYTGAGHYFNLFDNLNLRLNKAGGTLRSYYDSDLGVQLFAQQVVNLQNELARNEDVFNVKPFSADGNNTNVVSLSDVTGLAVAQAVKIMSNTQSVIDATINDIMGNDVELDVVVPDTYTLADQARLVRQL